MPLHINYDPEDKKTEFRFVKGYKGELKYTAKFDLDNLKLIHNEIGHIIKEIEHPTNWFKLDPQYNITREIKLMKDKVNAT